MNESNNKNNAPHSTIDQTHILLRSFFRAAAASWPFCWLKVRLKTSLSLSLSVGSYAMRFEKCAQNGRSSGCALSRFVSISASLIPVHDVLYVSELGQEIFSQNLKNCCVVCVCVLEKCVRREKREKAHRGLFLLALSWFLFLPRLT